MFLSSTLVERLSLALGLALILVCGVVVAVGQARPPAAFFVVTNTKDSGAGSLRQAILDANASAGSDLVNITANGTLNLLSALPVITDVVTLQGPGTSQFKVDGQDLYRVFDIDGVRATIADLTVQWGNVTGTSEDGAGIRTNRALTLTNVDVLSNTAAGDGGGVYVAGDLTLTSGRFQNNLSTSGVGGALRNIGVANVSGTQFVSNTARGDGGAVFALEAVTMTNVLFQDNQCKATSCDGGALFAFSQTRLIDTQFVSNTAQDQGGGASAPGVAIVTNGLFQNNRSVFGAGGGLYAQDVADLSGTHFVSNTARGSGGGMYALAMVTMTNGLFQDNQSTLGMGGGLAAAGTVNMSGTRFVRNGALQGGSLYHALGNGRVVNSLFAGNIATTTLGTAILLAATGTVEVVHVTIASPAVASGSAIDVLTGTLGITNTLIASHTIGISNTGGTVMQDYNLFLGNGANTQGVISGGANNVAGDPKFVNPTSDDYHLNAGSAAVDTGMNAGVTSDIDGEARPQFAGFDIGFDEFIPLRTFLPLVMR